MTSGAAPKFPKWRTRLLGEPHKQSLPWQWYAYRLGLIDDEGEPVEGKDEVHEALGAYLTEFAGLAEAWPPPPRKGDKDAPWATRFRCRRRLDEDDSENVWRHWHWWPPERPRQVVHARRRFWTKGSRVSLRLALGHLWRGRLWRCLSHHLKEEDGRTPDELRHPLVKVKCGLPLHPKDTTRALALHVHARLRDPALRAVVLGPGWSGPDPDPGLLEPPKADWWWWLSRSNDRFRWVVVDLDLHGEEQRDRDAFEARLRLLTSKGAPEPELIVTSRRGRGRHLWYRAPLPAGVAYGEQGDVPRATFWSDRFRAALGKAGVEVGSGRVEVFPEYGRTKETLPALPFGPLSDLCRSDGSVAATADPLEDIVRWHRRHRRLKPVSDFTFPPLLGVEPEEVELARAPRGKVLLVHSAAVLDDADDPGEVVLPINRRAKLDGVTLDEARDIYERGSQRGHTNEETPIVTRYIKHHLPRPRPRRDFDTPDSIDRAAFERWNTHGSDRMGDFCRYFSKAQPFATVPQLRAGDIRWMAERCCDISPGDPRPRISLFVTLAFAVAWARGANRDADDGGAVVVGLNSRQWCEWRSRYKPQVALLRRASLVRVAHREVVPGTQRRGQRIPSKCREYAVTLPKAEGVVHLIYGPPVLMDVMAPYEHADWFKRFVGGSKDWRATLIANRGRP